jgi:CBS-domain-containing membrane protein
MKAGPVKFALAVAVRVVLAFTIGIAFGLGALLWNGTLHDPAAHHAIAQTAGTATIWSFLLLMVWWTPRLVLTEID